jgi:hypothetical protein
MFFTVVFVGQFSSLMVLNIEASDIESAKVMIAELMELMGPLVKKCHIYSDSEPILEIVLNPNVNGTVFGEFIPDGLGGHMLVMGKYKWYPESVIKEFVGERVISREEFDIAFKQYHGSTLSGDKWENLFPMKISELKTKFGTEVCAFL